MTDRSIAAVKECWENGKQRGNVATRMIMGIYGLETFKRSGGIHRPTSSFRSVTTHIRNIPFAKVETLRWDEGSCWFSKLWERRRDRLLLSIKFIVRQGLQQEPEHKHATPTTTTGRHVSRLYHRSRSIWEIYVGNMAIEGECKDIKWKCIRWRRIGSY